MPTPRKPLLDRWTKLVRKGKVSQCWLWIGATINSGYGTISTGGAFGKTLAHRAAYLLFIGDIPKGMCVLHRCDNKLCVNPKHLFLGTKRDNTRDMLRKGRHRSREITHCPQGHRYTPENTYLEKTKTGTARRCLTCKQRYR